MSNDGNTVLNNFVWRLMERFGAQLIAVLVSIVLARILSPTDYGTVALMNVFINILTVFINGGLSFALIQKKDADELDFSSVFIGQMVICIVLYFFLFISAPLISRFYEKAEIESMIRVLGLTLIIAGVKNIQTAYVSRNMQFRLFFFATLGGTVGAAFLGVWLALRGYGAWALVGQSLFNNLTDTIILWILVKWRPKRKFSYCRLLSLFSFSWKILVSNLMDVGYNNLRSLIIGKVYSPSDLAFYDKGKSWPNLITNNVNSSIDSVLFPALSSEQEDVSRIKAMTRRAIKTSTYIMSPLLIGLAACGEPLIRLVLTEKWLPAVPFQMIFCLTYLFYPIHTANLNAINAMGRSDLFLKLEIIKKVVGIVLLAASVPISAMAICYSLLFSSILSQIINSWPNKKLLNYGYYEQLKDIMPNLFLSAFMGFCIYWLKYLALPDILVLLIQLLVGVFIYIVGSAILHNESYNYVKGFLSNHLKK